MMFEVVFSYITVLISGIIFLLCYKTLTDKKSQINIKKVIVLLILIALEMVNNIYNVYIFRTTVGFMILFLICKFWYKDNSKKGIYYTILISMTSMMMELLSLIIISGNFFDFEDINNSLIAKNCITIIISILPYYVLSIRKIKEILNKYEEKITSKMSNEVLLVAILLIVNIAVLQYNLDYKNNFIYISCLVAILVVSILVLVLHKVNFHKKNLEVRNQFLGENIKNYEIIADEYSNLKHNLNHDLLSVKTVANPEASKLIDEIIKKYNKNYEYTAKLGKIPKGIQGMICLKLHEAKANNINVEIRSELSAKIDQKFTAKNYLKLCTTLGIILDNALEAAKQSKEKSVFIYLKEENKKLNIKIMNTFTSVMDLDKIGKRGYSTKKVKSGIGLNYINKEMKKEFGIKKEIINNIFIVSLMFKFK